MPATWLMTLTSCGFHANTHELSIVQKEFFVAFIECDATQYSQFTI